MKSIVVLLTLFCLCQGTGCPDNWIQYHDSDRCYYVSSQSATFYEAMEYCESVKSQLAPVSTCGQEIDLSSILASGHGQCPEGKKNCEEFWIGMHDVNGTNDWTTARGLKIDKNLQCRFTGRQFPKGNGSCVLMSFKDNSTKGAWTNADCSKKLKFVCITCPDGFDYMPEINECLYINSKPNNWTDAVKACPTFKRKAQLLTIKNAIKQEAVRRFLQHQLTKEEYEHCDNPYEGWTTGGNIVWTSGQTTKPENCDTPYVWKPVGAAQIPFTYTNWQPEVPNCDTDDENCVVVATSQVYDYRWDDVICYAELCSVCEF